MFNLCRLTGSPPPAAWRPSGRRRRACSSGPLRRNPRLILHRRCAVRPPPRCRISPEQRRQFPCQELHERVILVGSRFPKRGRQRQGVRSLLQDPTCHANLEHYGPLTDPWQARHAARGTLSTSAVLAVRDTEQEVTPGRRTAARSTPDTQLEHVMPPTASCGGEEKNEFNCYGLGKLHERSLRGRDAWRFERAAQATLAMSRAVLLTGLG